MLLFPFLSRAIEAILYHETEGISQAHTQKDPGVQHKSADAAGTFSYSHQPLDATNSSKLAFKHSYQLILQELRAWLDYMDLSISPILCSQIQPTLNTAQLLTVLM